MRFGFVCYLFAALFLCPILRGTTYYVDSASGNDSNSGTSAAAAWRSLAKVNSFRFSPGDTALLHRGSLWREQLNFPSSGAANQPITIDAYGDGDLPVISGADLIEPTLWGKQDEANIWQASVPVQPNVVLFDGAKGQKQSSLSSLKAPLDWFWASKTLYVFSLQSPATSCTHPGVESGVRPSAINLTGISYVTLKNIAVSGANAIHYGEGAGIWAITVHLEGPTPGNLEISNMRVINGAGDGIHIENAQRSNIDSNTVSYNDGAGIEIYHSNGKFPVTSGTITNNQVHHNSFNGIFVVGCPRAERCRSVVYPEGLTVTGVKIMGNTVYNNGAGIYLHETNDSVVANNTAYSNTNTSQKGEGYCVGISGSSSNLIEKNNCHHARLSGIELSIDTGSPPFGSSNNVIRYNSIHDDGSHGIFTNYVPSQGNKILYNLIYNHPQGSCIMANYKGHEIYNNTCYNSKIGIHLYVSSSTQETGNISVKNNLFVHSSQFHVLIEKGVQGPFDFSNNLYFPEGNASFNWKGSPMGFADWRAATGLDVRSILADPRFSSASPASPKDFVLSPGSPAIGHGADLDNEKSKALSPSASWPAQIELSTQNPGRWDIGAFIHMP